MSPPGLRADTRSAPTAFYKILPDVTLAYQRNLSPPGMRVPPGMRADTRSAPSVLFDAGSIAHLHYNRLKPEDLVPPERRREWLTARP